MDVLCSKILRLKDGPLVGHTGKEYMVPPDGALLVEKTLVLVGNSAFIEGKLFEPTPKSVGEDRLENGVRLEGLARVGYFFEK